MENNREVEIKEEDEFEPAKFKNETLNNYKLNLIYLANKINKINKV